MSSAVCFLLPNNVHALYLEILKDERGTYFPDKNLVSDKCCGILVYFGSNYMPCEGSFSYEGISLSLTFQAS